MRENWYDTDKSFSNGYSKYPYSKKTSVDKMGKSPNIPARCEHNSCSRYGFMRAVSGMVVCDVCFDFYHERSSIAQCSSADSSVPALKRACTEKALKEIKLIKEMLA